MGDSAFTEDIVQNLGDLLGLPIDSWQRRRLKRKLRELEVDVPIFQRRDAISQPSKVRDRLLRIERNCAKASSLGSARFERAILRLVGRSETTRALLLWQAAMLEDRARPEAAIVEGGAELALERLLADPEALDIAARAAREAITKKAKSGQGGPRKTADWPLDQVFILLGTLFWELTRKRPRISVGSQSRAPTGYFLRFLSECLPLLGWSGLSDEAIRHRLRALRDPALTQLADLSS